MLSRVKLALVEVRRMSRLLRAPAGTRWVGYTRPHTIYTDVFDRRPPDGFAYYREAKTPWLKPLERQLRRRLSLYHADQSTPSTLGDGLPMVLECEGRPMPERLADPRFRHVFVWSEWAGGEYLRQGKVTLLRPSVPLPSARRTAEPDPPVLLAVGYGGMVKGFDVVARVYDMLRDECPVRLVIAGTFGHNVVWYPEITRAAYEQADFPGLERRLRADPRVSFRLVSRAELLRDVYPSATVYLHLSRMDTFGYSVLEAMAAELPVVATAINAIPEMVRHGETGFLVPTRGADINSEAWREIVLAGAVEHTRALLRDSALRRRMGAAGLDRVRHAFDIDYKRRELARVYRHVLGDRSGPGGAARHA